MYNATNKTGSSTRLWSVSWDCCTVNAAKSEVFPIKASSPRWAQITASPWGLTQQWSERWEECVLQVWMVPCVSVKRFSTASNDAFLTGSWDVWGHFGLEKFYSFLYFQHLHLHLVIWQTLLSKATYNWGIHKAIHLEEAIRQRKCS